MEILEYVPLIKFVMLLKFQWKLQPIKIIIQVRILKDKYQYICCCIDSIWINKITLSFAHHKWQTQLYSTSKPIYQTIKEYMNQKQQLITFE
ncbi:unnamed protein product [Paramecium primaurelia]|uniref:Uncharacterized protein n=1 Tax=Paramecium primaurelia TaxID=5886 RepID=A0A8S1QC50_PARPR|nr:unnamed protein product [Paramecium primaurelia]CAD8112567.1 unnamed protein product [Paramecium primaurelia]